MMERIWTAACGHVAGCPCRPGGCSHAASCACNMHRLLLAIMSPVPRLRPAMCALPQFEVQRGGVLSRPLAVAALPSRDAVAEARTAQRELEAEGELLPFQQAPDLCA